MFLKTYLCEVLHFFHFHSIKKLFGITGLNKMQHPGPNCFSWLGLKHHINQPNASICIENCQWTPETAFWADFGDITLVLYCDLCRSIRDMRIFRSIGSLIHNLQQMAVILNLECARQIEVHVRTNQAIKSKVQG